MKKSLVILIVLIYVFVINMYFVPNFVNATESINLDVKLNKLKFDEAEVDVDKISANKSVIIPVTLDYTGDVAMVTVAFKNEKGDVYGPSAIYIDSIGKKDLQIGLGQLPEKGTTYYLTDIYFMKKTENGYDIQKQYVTKKSNTTPNGKDIVEFDYSYSFKVYSSSTENTKLKMLKFNETKIDLDKIDTSANKSVIIPVTLDYTGDVAMVTVAFKNEKGDVYGPSAIYIDSIGKKDLQIGLGQLPEKGTTYYLTDIYFMKKTENGYDIQKQYVTKKSNTTPNGYDIVEFNYDYSFKVYSSADNDIQKQKIQEFLNKDENLIFSYHNYSKASEIPLTDEWGIPETITLKYGKIIEDDSPEISKIVGEFKAYYFTKDDADKFLMEKMGIKFSDLNDYKTYEETHTTSSNKKVYYQITEGYGTEPIEYKVEELETLENGNIKVKISYKNGLINIVTLKPNGDSYLFVSCVNNDPEYKLLYNRETINKETKEDNTIAKKSIPQTGIRENIIIFSTIMIIGIMVIVILIKNNKLKDI